MASGEGSTGATNNDSSSDSPPPKRPRGRPPKYPKSDGLTMAQVQSFFDSVERKLESSMKQIIAEALTPLRSLLQTQINSVSDRISSLELECRAEIARLNSVVTDIKAVVEHCRAPAADSPVDHACAGPSVVSPTSPVVFTARKNNLVVFGVPECPQGTLRHERMSHDSSQITDLFGSIDSSFSGQSIRDFRRLGKYSSESSKPRPLLVSFLRATDVQFLLSRCHNLSQPLRVQPDRSPQERSDRALLLKERYQLIESGQVDRSSIKIKHLSMFINDSLYCEVVNSSLVRSHTLSDLAPSLDALDGASTSDPQ